MCVKFLLEYKADPDILDVDGYTPIHAAVERGFIDIVKLLLDFGAKPCLYKEARNSVRNVRIIQYWTPLHIACQNNYPDILKLLLDSGAPANAQNNTKVTPLHIAAQQKAIEPLDILLEYGADIMLADDDNEPPLFLAIDARLLKHVTKLCDEHTVTMQNTDGYTALHIAAKLGYSEIVQYLIEKESNLFACDNQGNTPLHLAVIHKHKECVKLLLDAKSDMLARNNNNESSFVLSSGEILALMKNYLEKNKESVRAEAIDKTPRSTKVAPSRLRAQMSPSQMDQRLQQSPSRLQGKRSTPSKSDTISNSSKKGKDREKEKEKEKELTVNLYEERITNYIDTIHKQMLKQLGVMRKAINALNEDFDNYEQSNK
ncbi:hypothetical protein M9Y10_013942 [Tritrichomonas musculus]|uniref:Ankyrin repeat protein n=1 Tax=Tritrichomonas musculus TaxID=1915356 RepID=A0ABR2KY55_9EUKA